MSATATPVASDRSDFRTVTVGGAKLGVATAVAVVAFLAASQRVPITGGLRGGVEALIVLAAGVAVAFLPAQWTAARSTEGIAGAAALGLVATVVFSAIDIVLLRPFKAYPGRGTRSAAAARGGTFPFGGCSGPSWRGWVGLSPRPAAKRPSHAVRFRLSRRPSCWR